LPDGAVRAARIARSRWIAILRTAVVSQEPRNALHRAWPFVALRGVLAVAVSAAILTRPTMPRGLLLALLGSYLFIDGVMALGTAVRAERGAPGRRRYILEGVVSVVIGALAFARPATVATAALTLIAARAIITGLVETVTAISLRSPGGEHYWPIGLSGVASLGFGVFLLASPRAGALAVLLLAGLYILLFGLGMIAAAFRLYRAHARLRAQAAG
jgi:uncharacterized membrane protein HdeD (DUF308 family)